ncbi:glycosyltransferase family 4 protein [Poseidonibacter ostreae]|uniref:Glycosyltransferase n=1 Tax=Poseidonibacter ostreae TaxID=2654171 RepID=A0A6L4WUT0_9BACT|nr:glycosyltransferase family 4 protein [Poseidonibacter ostreae]KAB7886159.1 glycosyltransferase [Poseidonibacter ostreae]KAB7888575.1 glycosyltransferase [Poseidonibacter ostreae]
MKVIQLLPELNEGGVERGVVELNREYSKLDIESIVISNGGKLSNQIDLDGGKHITFDVSSKNIFTSVSRVFKLRKILEELKPDILHVRSRVPAWLVFFANKSLNIKVVSTVHGFNSVSFYSKIMTKADAVICVSNSIKEYIQKNYKTKSEIISVIPRGIDLELFNSLNIDKVFISNFKEEFQLENKFIVSTVGRITQLKDYETFIKAIFIIKKEIKEVRALIVGGVRSDKEDYLNSLKKLIKELKLEENIIFTGSQNKITEIYALSDVVVSSSKKPESFGRAVAESIAMNTPVIATNHGGVKDIIIENENGFFFDVGNEKQLAEKIIKSKNLSFDGYNYISNNFSLDNMLDKTLNVYKKVISDCFR